MPKSVLYLLAACMSVSAVMASTAVWAGFIPAPVDVPEPGLFGVVAAGVASVLLVARLSRRSK